MSLINEALKRTRDAAGNTGAPQPAVANYRIQSKVETTGTKGTFLVTLLIAGAVLVGVISIGSRIAKRVQTVQDGFASNSDAPTTELKSTPPPIKPDTQPAPMTEISPAVETPPSLAPTTAVVTPKADGKVNEDQIVTKLMERLKAEQGVATKPGDPPKLVLQGITYAQDGGEAMINNLTVREGDDIEGARVVTIESRRVKLNFNGREISLRLP